MCVYFQYLKNIDPLKEMMEFSCYSNCVKKKNRKERGFKKKQTKKKLKKANK